MKRRMLSDGDGASTLPQAAGMRESGVAEALRLLWREVVATHSTGAPVDYDACLAALDSSRVADQRLRDRSG